MGCAYDNIYLGFIHIKIDRAYLHIKIEWAYNITTKVLIKYPCKSSLLRKEYSYFINTKLGLYLLDFSNDS